MQFSHEIQTKTASKSKSPPKHQQLSLLKTLRDHASSKPLSPARKLRTSFLTVPTTARALTFETVQTTQTINLNISGSVEKANPSRVLIPFTLLQTSEEFFCVSHQTTA